MGRSSSRCEKEGSNKGAWTAHEDQVLKDYVKEHGEGKWGKLSRETGLKRCGKYESAEHPSLSGIQKTGSDSGDMAWNFIMDLNAGELSISEFQSSYVKNNKKAKL